MPFSASLQQSAGPWGMSTWLFELLKRLQLYTPGAPGSLMLSHSKWDLMMRSIPGCRSLAQLRAPVLSDTEGVRSLLPFPAANPLLFVIPRLKLIFLFVAGGLEFLGKQQCFEFRALLQEGRQNPSVYWLRVNDLGKTRCWKSKPTSSPMQPSRRRWQVRRCPFGKSAAVLQGINNCMQPPASERGNVSHSQTASGCLSGTMVVANKTIWVRQSLS